MSFSRFISVIIGRRVAFLTTLCCVVALVMLGSYLLPAAIHRQGRAARRGQGIVRPAQPTIASRLATEAELLQSERVAIAALALLGLQKTRSLRQSGRTRPTVVANSNPGQPSNCRRNSTSSRRVTPTSSPSPIPPRILSLAAKTLNALLKAYVDTARELRGESATQSSATFSGRTNRLKAALDLAAEKLARFQRENGVASTDERLDIENLRLSELNAQLVMLQSTAANAAGRQRHAAGGSGMEEVLQGPVGFHLERRTSRGNRPSSPRCGPSSGISTRAIAEQRESLG